jgi:putative transposase
MYHIEVKQRRSLSAQQNSQLAGIGRLGRERHERRRRAGGLPNGSRTGRMKTAAVMVEHAAPQVRDTAEPFVANARENLADRTEALDDLALEFDVRGLSIRDIEDTFSRRAGPPALEPDGGE